MFQTAKDIPYLFYDFICEPNFGANTAQKLQPNKFLVQAKNSMGTPIGFWLVRFEPSKASV